MELVTPINLRNVNQAEDSSLQACAESFRPSSSFNSVSESPDSVVYFEMESPTARSYEFDPGHQPFGNTKPLIGSFISVISTSNLKYEGILWSMNDYTLTMGDVIFYGTEGRNRRSRKTEVDTREGSLNFVTLKLSFITSVAVLGDAIKRLDRAIAEVGPSTEVRSRVHEGERFLLSYHQVPRETRARN